jgi:glucose-1-phosphatase
VVPGSSPGGPTKRSEKPGRFFNVMAQTKNIIFDLGGVLLDLDFQRSIDAFEKLGLEGFENMFSQFKADELFKKLETGHVSEADFYAAVKKRTTKEITQAEIDDAYNALILLFRTESLAFLDELATDYKLFLLSNTNSIHLKYFKKLLTQQTGKPLLDAYFTKAWYSNEIGLRKPGAEIFEFVLKDENLRAEETLFIDDTYMNIETAQKLGFKTHLLLPAERIELLDFNAL